MGVALVALVLSIALVAVMLTRQRERHRPEVEPGEEPPARKRPTRQEKILQKLEPLPELPTLMDLVREEIAEAGINELPGHEGIPDPVKLKVYRRDHQVVADCPHNAYEYVVDEEIVRAEATDDDVALLCYQCAAGSTGAESPGTDIEDETLSE